MYEMDRAFPVHIGPIFNSSGEFVGIGYASKMDSTGLLIKNPFNENYLVTNITPLLDRGYQFSMNQYTLPGCPGMGAGEEFGWNNF